MFCKNCGAEINEGGQFCPKCGSKIGKRQMTQSQTQTGQKADRKKWNKKVIFGAIGVVAIAIVSIFLCLYSSVPPERVEVGGIEYVCFADVDGFAALTVGYVGKDDTIIIPSEIKYKFKTYPVRSIAEYTFENCSSLKSITIPDSVTRIYYNAFSGCSSLESIDIPDSVTSIGYCAFENCSSLKSIDIPDSVTSIDDGTFSGCSSLESITIPDSVTSIGFYAFQDCSSLDLIIPPSVTDIRSDAFDGCRSVKYR